MRLLKSRVLYYTMLYDIMLYYITLCYIHIAFICILFFYSILYFLSFIVGRFDFKDAAPVSAPVPAPASAPASAPSVRNTDWYYEYRQVVFKLIQLAEEDGASGLYYCYHRL